MERGAFLTSEEIDNLEEVCNLLHSIATDVNELPKEVSEVAKRINEKAFEASKLLNDILY